MAESLITVESICNQALSWLATGRIASIDENTDRARLVHDNYYEARDSTLESAAWTFATKRFEMLPESPSLPPDPPYGYGQRFLLDPDVLRVIECRQDSLAPNGASNLDWRREGQYIVSDSQIIFAKTIVRIIDVTLYSSLFRQTLAARLAAMMSPTISESNVKTETLWSLYGNYLNEARATDSSQGKSDRIRGRSLIQQVR